MQELCEKSKQSPKNFDKFLAKFPKADLIMSSEDVNKWGFLCALILNKLSYYGKTQRVFFREIEGERLNYCQMTHSEMLNRFKLQGYSEQQLKSALKKLESKGLLDIDINGSSYEGNCYAVTPKYQKEKAKSKDIFVNSKDLTIESNGNIIHLTLFEAAILNIIRTYIASNIAQRVVKNLQMIEGKEQVTCQFAHKSILESLNLTNFDVFKVRNCLTKMKKLGVIYSIELKKGFANHYTLTDFSDYINPFYKEQPKEELKEVPKFPKEKRVNIRGKQHTFIFRGHDFDYYALSGLNDNEVPKGNSWLADRYHAGIPKEYATDSEMNALEMIAAGKKRELLKKKKQEFRRDAKNLVAIFSDHTKAFTKEELICSVSGVEYFEASKEGTIGYFDVVKYYASKNLVKENFYNYTPEVVNGLIDFFVKEKSVSGLLFMQDEKSFEDTFNHFTNWVRLCKGKSISETKEWKAIESIGKNTTPKVFESAESKKRKWIDAKMKEFKAQFKEIGNDSSNYQVIRLSDNSIVEEYSKLLSNQKSKLEKEYLENNLV